MSTLYFIKSTLVGGYDQYPCKDYELFKTLFKKSKAYEQILMQRVGNTLHMLYVMKVGRRKKIGIGVSSDHMVDSYDFAISFFRNMVRLLGEEKLLVKCKRRRYKMRRGKLGDKHVAFKHFAEDHILEQSSGWKNWTPLPVPSLEISKNDVVECDFDIKGSAWIVDKVRRGYHHVYVTICNEKRSHKDNIRSFLRSAITDNTFTWKMNIGGGNPYKK